MPKGQVIPSLSELVPPDFFVAPSGDVMSGPKAPGAEERRFLKIHHSLHSLLHEPQRTLKQLQDIKDITEALAFCSAAIVEVLNEHVWLPHTQVLRDLQDGSLRIMMVAPLPDEVETFMGYTSAEGTISIFYYPGLRKEYYKTVLLNELMSYLVRRTHERCRIPGGSINFLKEDGSIDQTLREKFERSITEGVERIDTIKSLWARRKEKLSPEENHLLIQFLAAAKHYTPQAFPIRLSAIGGAGMFRKMVKAGRIYREEGDYIVPGPDFPAENTFSRGRIQGDYFVTYYTSNMQSARGRIEGFLGDFDQIQKAMTQMNDHPLAYANREDDVKLHEMGTFVAQFPKPLLELLFPDFLTYMHWYSLRCSSGVSKNPPPKAVSSFTVAGAPWFFSPPPMSNKQRYAEKTLDKPQSTKERPRAGKGPQ